MVSPDGSVAIDHSVRWKRKIRLKYSSGVELPHHPEEKLFAMENRQYTHVLPSKTVTAQKNLSKIKKVGNRLSPNQL
jgi:hypothetical protein